MQFTTRLKVCGAKSSKGDFEGTAFDSTKLFVEMSLDESKGNAKGFATQELVWGDSTEFNKIAHLPFPFDAEATLEIVTSGKGVSKQRVTSLRPVQVSPAKP